MTLNESAMHWPTYWPRSRGMALCGVHVGGARIIDCGGAVTGGLQAGLQMARVCTAGLAEVICFDRRGRRSGRAGDDRRPGPGVPGVAVRRLADQGSRSSSRWAPARCGRSPHARRSSSTSPARSSRRAPSACWKRASTRPKKSSPISSSQLPRDAEKLTLAGRPGFEHGRHDASGRPQSWRRHCISCTN